MKRKMFFTIFLITLVSIFTFSTVQTNNETDVLINNLDDTADYKIVITLADELFPELELQRDNYKLIKIENLIVKGEKYLGPYIWHLTYKQKNLIHEDENEEIGAGGEVFIEVNLNIRKAKLLGYGE
jgi:hypothetical protein